MKYVKKYSFYLILILASALRLWQLNRRDFWYDEAFTGIAVKESWTGMLKMIMADVHPPLYYLALKFFASFFGYSVFGIRLFSVIFGVLCIFAVYLFTRELFNKKAALYAGIIAAVSPFAIQYSMEGRMYSMFAFFIIMAAYFLVKQFPVPSARYSISAFVTTGKGKLGARNSILFGLFLGLAALTHYMGIIFIPVFYAVYGMYKFPVLSSQFPVSKKRLLELFKSFLPDKNILVGYAVALLIFTPWIPSFIKHLVKNAASNSLDWIRPANFGDIAVNIQMFIFGTPLGEMSSGMPGPNEFYGIADISMWIAVTIFITAVVLYLFRVETRYASSLETVLLLSLGFMVLVWFLGFLGKYYFVARYLLPAGYFIFVLLGVWLARIRLPYRVMAAGFYVILLFLTIPLGYSEGWNEFSKNQDKYKNNGFYILNAFDYVIAKYYLGADRFTLYNVDWPPYNPDYWAAIGPSLKRTENFEDLKNDKEALIISNTQLGGQDNVNFDPTGLQLIAQYKNILIYRFR
ncbi:MAG: DUF2723 domain-containing protein [Candidatus Moranbacteria bacterium]|nr:DUF2723 domain-containing protein [Candidatus Moranbacteria bacterium]